MAKKFTLLLVLLVVVAVLYFKLGDVISLEYFSARRRAIEQDQQQHFLQVALLYFLLYILVTALSLPGAAVMTLVGGALFGLGWGLLLVSFASTIGATLAFLIARLLVRDWVQQRYGDRLAAINRGVARDGNFYLFTLRLVPLFPFFLINLLMALTPIKAWSFYWVSQLGMLAGTVVYVNAGTQLAQLQSPADIASPALILSFVLLGLFPWLARGALTRIKERRRLQAF